MDAKPDSSIRERSSRHKDDDRSDERRRRQRSRSRDRNHDRASERHRPRDDPEHGEKRRRDRNRSHSPRGSLRRRRSRSRDRGRDNRRDDRQERGSERSTHRRRTSPAPSPRKQSPLRRRGPLPDQQTSFAVDSGEVGEEAAKPKEQPNFGNSGALAKAANSIQQADGNVVTLKYHEPPEARKPPAKDDWKLFVFKGSDVVDIIGLSARSCWLVGREAAVVDILAEHPSLSKQHAVVQFRHVEKRNEFGDKIGRVKPYLIDLESANKTLLNGKKIAESRYIELRDKDIVQFGHSTREYVVMLAPKE
ncbi:SMAD/FHA domain-containing protein [Plectosphaerella plurivora]|uniref:SMAD/FHA domain-containing protein n=1 Tax=Plectosphaerella plurivora TaxID=936078 RepID=A0A9P9A997_9PEZI|nr:SMAD/FHA domain-containing protein [Plectosphaerella plurivora]